MTWWTGCTDALLGVTRGHVAVDVGPTEGPLESARVWWRNRWVAVFGFAVTRFPPKPEHHDPIRALFSEKPFGFSLFFLRLLFCIYTLELLHYSNLALGAACKSSMGPTQNLGLSQSWMFHEGFMFDDYIYPSRFKFSVLECRSFKFLKSFYFLFKFLSLSNALLKTNVYNLKQK